MGEDDNLKSEGDAEAGCSIGSVVEADVVCKSSLNSASIAIDAGPFHQSSLGEVNEAILHVGCEQNATSPGNGQSISGQNNTVVKQYSDSAVDVTAGCRSEDADSQCIHDSNHSSRADQATRLSEKNRTMESVEGKCKVDGDLDPGFPVADVTISVMPTTSLAVSSDAVPWADAANEKSMLVDESYVTEAVEEEQNAEPVTSMSDPLNKDVVVCNLVEPMEVEASYPIEKCKLDNIIVESGVSPKLVDACLAAELETGTGQDENGGHRVDAASEHSLLRDESISEEADKVLKYELLEAKFCVTEDETIKLKSEPVAPMSELLIKDVSASNVKDPVEMGEADPMQKLTTDSIILKSKASAEPVGASVALEVDTHIGRDGNAGYQVDAAREHSLLRDECTVEEAEARGLKSEHNTSPTQCSDKHSSNDSEVDVRKLQEHSLDPKISIDISTSEPSVAPEAIDDNLIMGLNTRFAPDGHGTQQEEASIEKSTLLNEGADKVEGALLKSEPQSFFRECGNKSIVNDVDHTMEVQDYATDWKPEVGIARTKPSSETVAGCQIAILDVASGRDHTGEGEVVGILDNSLIVNAEVQELQNNLRCFPGECFNERNASGSAQADMKSADYMEVQECREDKKLTKGVPASHSKISCESGLANLSMNLDAISRVDENWQCQVPDANKGLSLRVESLVNGGDIQQLKFETGTSLQEGVDKIMASNTAEIGSSGRNSVEMQNYSPGENLAVGSGVMNNTVKLENAASAAHHTAVPISEMTVGSLAVNFESNPRQDEDGISLSNGTNAQPHVLEASPAFDDGNKFKRLACEPGRLTEQCLDKHMETRLTSIDSNMEDAMEIIGSAEHRKFGMMIRITDPRDSHQSIAECLNVESAGDKDVESQKPLNYAADKSLPLPDESFDEGVDAQGLMSEVHTARKEFLDNSELSSISPGSSKVEDLVDMPESSDGAEQVTLHDGQQISEEPVVSAANSEKGDKHTGCAWSGSLNKEHHISYQLPPENEGEFSASDLVWGKVKSHPWWPGQIFHLSDSSEKAMKYYRRDCYLVAYFGDRSFSWNEVSALKPLCKYFSHEEKQSNSEAFQNAVNCALSEVSRRVEYGLTCLCTPEDVYEKIKLQIFENAGIRKESRQVGLDRSTGLDTFKPDKLLEYVRALAQSPSTGTDRVHLVIARSQLLAFYRMKGYNFPPEFHIHEGLLDNNTEMPVHEDQRLSSRTEHADSVVGDEIILFGKGKSKGTHKRKHNLKDIVYHRRREKSLSDLMGESMFYLDGEYDSDEKDSSMSVFPTSDRKRKTSERFIDDPMVHGTARTISLAKVSHTTALSPRQSFMVGESIVRVASQLTSSPSILKRSGDGKHSQQSGVEFVESLDSPQDPESGKMVSSTDEHSLDDLLSQLHFAARNPNKGGFFDAVISFFSEFRKSVVSTRHRKKDIHSLGKVPGKRRKSGPSAIGAPETFEFDEMGDSYWTDMVVQHSSEKKSPRHCRKRRDYQVGNGDSEKSVVSTLRKNHRKQYFYGNHDPAVEKLSGIERQQKQLPTELVLNFNEADSVPSEANLNKMFRCFGPLRETETEVDQQTSRARVVFKRRADAEVAYSSAAVFNIFGPALVNFQLNYSPSASFKNSPLAVVQVPEIKS